MLTTTARKSAAVGNVVASARVPGLANVIPSDFLAMM
jgi:hypothetical protein